MAFIGCVSIGGLCPVAELSPAKGLQVAQCQGASFCKTVAAYRKAGRQQVSVLACGRSSAWHIACSTGGKPQFTEISFISFSLIQRGLMRWLRQRLQQYGYELALKFHPVMLPSSRIGKVQTQTCPARHPLSPPYAGAN